MPVVRIGKHTLRIDESDQFDSLSDEETTQSKSHSGMTLEDAKRFRNRGDKWDGRYVGERAERIRLSAIRQKARKKGQDCPVTWEEWQRFLRSNHVEDISGVEIRVKDSKKPFTIKNLEVVGL